LGNTKGNFSFKNNFFVNGKVLMAAVGGPTRQSRVSMSVSMSLVQGGAAGAPQGAILAAAAPYYQPPAVPQDVQPDRPIGYGAFGVVW